MKRMTEIHKVIFRLRRHWKTEEKTVDLYEEIKAGRKTSEWRDASDYWIKRLTTLVPLKNLDRCSGKELMEWANMPLDVAAEGAGITLKQKLKVNRAWFTVGYPLYSLPRLETDITDLILHPREGQLETQIANIVEVVSCKLYKNLRELMGNE